MIKAPLDGDESASRSDDNQTGNGPRTETEDGRRPFRMYSMTGQDKTGYGGGNRSCVKALAAIPSAARAETGIETIPYHPPTASRSNGTQDHAMRRHGRLAKSLRGPQHQAQHEG